MTTLQKTIVTASLAIVAGAGVYEARQATQLRKQNQALQQQQSLMTDQIQHSQNPGDDAANSIASLREENAQLKSNQTELLKLRGEVGALQKQASDSDQRAKAAEEKLAALSSSASFFKGREASTINAAKQMSLAFVVFAQNHDNQFPTNISQISKELGGQFSIGGVELASFDLIDPSPARLDHRNAVILRERIARQAPDGSWERVYGFADGSVQTALSNDGNFEAWEKVNTYSPPTNQNQ